MSHPNEPNPALSDDADALDRHMTERHTIHVIGGSLNHMAAVHAHQHNGPYEPAVDHDHRVCSCDSADARLCYTVREALALAGPDDTNPRCWCPCHTRLPAL